MRNDHLMLVMTEQQIGTPMNRATRVLLMSGVAVAAGMAFSVPAMAATPSTGTTGTAVQATPRHSWTEDYSRSPSRCGFDGRRGVWSGDWDHFSCVYVSHGRHRGMWALVVSQSWHGGGHWHGGGNGNWHGNG